MTKRKETVELGDYYVAKNPSGSFAGRRVIVDPGEPGSPEFFSLIVKKNPQRKLEIGSFPGTERAENIGRRLGKLPTTSIVEGVRRGSGDSRAEAIRAELEANAAKPAKRIR